MCDSTQLEMDKTYYVHVPKELGVDVVVRTEGPTEDMPEPPEGFKAFSLKIEVVQQST